MNPIKITLPLNLNNPLVEKEILKEIQLRHIKPYTPSVIDLTHDNSQPVKLGVKEVLQLFDPIESLCIVYVPHYLTLCVISYIEKLLDFCRTNRLSEYKPVSRKLKDVITEYYHALQDEMPRYAYMQFLNQKDNFLQRCNRDLTIMYFTYGNAILAKFGKLQNEDVYTFTNMICEIIRHIEDYDRESQKKIAERTKTTPRIYKDVRLEYIMKLCNEIRGSYKIESNETTDLAIKVIIQEAKATVMELKNK